MRLVLFVVVGSEYNYYHQFSDFAQRLIEQTGQTNWQSKEILVLQVGTITPRVATCKSTWYGGVCYNHVGVCAFITCDVTFICYGSHYRAYKVITLSGQTLPLFLVYITLANSWGNKLYWLHKDRFILVPRRAGAGPSYKRLREVIVKSYLFQETFKMARTLNTIVI